MTTQIVERIAFEVDGEGDPVLLIHGLGGTSNTWTPIMSALARHKAIRLDLPGSARSAAVARAALDRAFRAGGAARVERSRRRARARDGAFAGHHRGQHLAVPSPAWCAASRCLARCLRRPMQRVRTFGARGQKARSEGIAGMQAIADALVQAATSAETKAKRPAAVASCANR